MLDFFDFGFTLGVSECLCDWVVLDFLALDMLIGHFAIGLSCALEVSFLLSVLLDALGPLIVAIIEAKRFVCVCSCGRSVTISCRHSNNSK